MSKVAKTTTITVGGKEYKLQHPGVRWYLENTDNSRDARGFLSVSKYAQNILDNVVVDPPGLKLDDFESVAELEELVQKADQFLKS